MDKTHWIHWIGNGWTSDGVALSRKSSPHDLHPRASPSASRWRCWVAQNKASIPRPSPNISASFSSSICCRKSTQSWAAASYLSPHAMAIWCCYCQLLIGFPRLLHFVSLRDLICMASSCFIYELLRTPHGSAWNIKWVPYGDHQSLFSTRVIFKLHWSWSSIQKKCHSIPYITLPHRTPAMKMLHLSPIQSAFKRLRSLRPSCCATSLLVSSAVTSWNSVPENAKERQDKLPLRRSWTATSSMAVTPPERWWGDGCQVSPVGEET